MLTLISHRLGFTAWIRAYDRRGDDLDPSKGRFLQGLLRWLRDALRSGPVVGLDPAEGPDEEGVEHIYTAWWVLPYRRAIEAHEAAHSGIFGAQKQGSVYRFAQLMEEGRAWDGGLNHVPVKRGFLMSPKLKLLGPPEDPRGIQDVWEHWLRGGTPEGVEVRVVHDR